MKKIIISSLFVAIFILGCKKEDSTTILDVKGSKWTIHYSTTVAADYFITFKSNNDFIYEEGDSYLDPAGTFIQSSDSIKWDFNSYGKGTYIYDGKLIGNDSMSGKISNSDYSSAGRFTAKKI
jgi:hypothetical protein